MKKIYSFALAAVAILSAASCQKEMANAPEVENGEKFTVVATAADTKTVLEGNVAYWMPGDKITIFDATGAPVVFTTNITEKAAKAEFTAESFNAPDSLVAVYNPTRSAALTDGKIYPLRAGGDQKPVAGSFDPNAAIAVGGSKAAGSNELVFNNIHALVKFTVGDVVPSSVKLVNNGGGIIVGLLYWNVEAAAIEHSGQGEASITVSGTYEKGQTYYIAVTPNEAKGGLSVYFDDVLVKNTGADLTIKPNTIYNLGTLPAVAEPEEPADVWEGENVATSVLPEFMFTDWPQYCAVTELKAYADTEKLYMRLKSKTTAGVGKIRFCTADTNPGTETIWYWEKSFYSTPVYKSSKANVDADFNFSLNYNGTPVELETVIEGEDLYWIMTVPRTAHNHTASAGAVNIGFVTYTPAESENGLMPKVWGEMLKVVLP